MGVMESVGAAVRADRKPGEHRAGVASQDTAEHAASASPDGLDRRQRANDKAQQLAEAILAGFDRHYALFRYTAQQAKHRFEASDYHAIREMARERINFYDLRVQEAVDRIEATFETRAIDETVWQRMKRAYVNLLTEHRQPELAETFFNSAITKILHRDYVSNASIFVRPQIATDYLDSDPPSYRIYYPRDRGLRRTLTQIVIDIGLACPWANIKQDLSQVVKAACRLLPRPFKAEVDLQIHVLRSLFYRNKGAYLIGRIVNDGDPIPFAVPILKNDKGQLYLDTVLFATEQIEVLFSFSRAYFMVDMEVPSAYVQFLRTLMPHKPKSELYTMLGLQKQGKTLYFRDFQHHMKHSTDPFIIAPGIKGLVMLVFTLPSFPYVFKIIKDKRKKDFTREFIASKYQLVKFHDRVGRMADTWEYSGVAFPRARFSQALMDELREFAPTQIEETRDTVIVKHLYIERRMVPLNIFIENASEAELDHAIREYGNAIKELVAANIFPGDMLYKNFGMTRTGRVVFYDYDEIQYLTECNFRRIPLPRTPEDEMASEPWYTIGPNDVFPEEFGTFLLGQPKVRKAFMKYHADLLEPEYWQARQQRIEAGMLEDVFPYPEEIRFVNQATAE